MIIEKILTPARTLGTVRSSSKKKILELIATTISEDVPAINGKDLFASLVSRERLGTTALGKGVAIPHCRNKTCTEPTGLFIQLELPVDFEAVDSQPVDLIFALVVPEDNDPQAHLNILKALAGRFQSDTLSSKLRGAASRDALYNTLVRGT